MMKCSFEKFLKLTFLGRLQFQKLNLELKRRFDAEGISFAFPTQTLYLKQDSEWRVTGPNDSAARN